MAAYYNKTPSVISLSVAIYLGAIAVIQLFSGLLSDRIGRRTVILFSLALFIFASLAIIWAPRVAIFLVLRFIQAFAATTMVLQRAIVRDNVGKNAEASKIVYVTMGMAVAPMLGPGIDGYLDRYFGLQSVLAFLGAIGLVIFLKTWFNLGEAVPLRPSRQSSQKADYTEQLKSQRFWGYCVSSTMGSGSSEDFYTTTESPIDQKVA